MLHFITNHYAVYTPINGVCNCYPLKKATNGKIYFVVEGREIVVPEFLQCVKPLNVM